MAGLVPAIHSVKPAGALLAPNGNPFVHGMDRRDKRGDDGLRDVRRPNPSAACTPTPEALSSVVAGLAVALVEGNKSWGP